MISATRKFKDNCQKGEFVTIKNNYKSNLLFLLIGYVGITSACNAVCPNRTPHQDIIVPSGTKMEAPKSETIRDGKIEVCEYIRTKSENEKTEKMFIYVLMDKGKTVYCGQTNDPTRRAREHSYEEGSYPKIFDQMLAIGYFNEEDTNAGEDKCVKSLEPQYNIQLRGGSDDDIEINRASHGTYTGSNGVYKVTPFHKQLTKEPKEQVRDAVTKDWFSKGYYTDEYGN